MTAPASSGTVLQFVLALAPLTAVDGMDTDIQEHAVRHYAHRAGKDLLDAADDLRTMTVARFRWPPPDPVTDRADYLRWAQTEAVETALRSAFLRHTRHSLWLVDGGPSFHFLRPDDDPASQPVRSLCGKSGPARPAPLTPTNEFCMCQSCVRSTEFAHDPRASALKTLWRLQLG